MSQRLYTYPEADALPANAGGTGGMMQSARRTLCQAYRRAPWAFTSLFPDSAVGQLQTALWDKICPEPPPPSQPLPDVPAWRAPCNQTYLVTVRYRIPNDPAVPNPSFATFQVQGPILGTTYRQTVSDGFEWGVIGSDGRGNPAFNFVFGVSGNLRKNAGGSIVSAVPQGATPPGCNTSTPPPRSYPDPFWPDANDYIGPPGPGTNAPGPNGPTSAPIIRLPPLPSFPLPPVVVIPFRPHVNVDVGPFNFQFDLGGVTLAFNPTVNLNLNFGGGVPQPTLPPGSPPVYLPPGGVADCQPCDLNGVIQAVNASRETVLEVVRDQTDILRPREASIQWTTATTPLTSGMVALPTNAVAVRVRFVDNPTNLKSQFGGGGAPNVVFAGWGFFGGASTEGGERVALDFIETRVAVPPNSTHFGFTAKDGRKATVSVGVLPAAIASRNFRLGRNLLWRVE